MTKINIETIFKRVSPSLIKNPIVKADIEKQFNIFTTTEQGNSESLKHLCKRDEEETEIVESCYHENGNTSILIKNNKLFYNKLLICVTEKKRCLEMIAKNVSTQNNYQSARVNIEYFYDSHVGKVYFSHVETLFLIGKEYMYYGIIDDEKANLKEYQRTISSSYFKRIKK